MARVIYYTLGGREMHVPKLVGAFVIFIALLMFFKAGADMIDSWDNIKFVNNCLEVAVGDEGKFLECQDQALKSMNVFVRPGQDSLNNKQFAMGILPPVSWLLFWLVILGLGLFFYRTGSFVVPLEERIVELQKPAPAQPMTTRPVIKPKKRKKKKK